MARNWLRFLFARSSAPAARPSARPARPYRPGLETLEDRLAPAVLTTFVNDNWALIQDADGSTTLSVGDIVDNRLDSNSPRVTGVYGVDAFGTVGASYAPGISITPGTTIGLVNAVFINDAIANTLVNGTVRVLEGTYNQEATVNKTVTLLGAQAGVSPFERPGLYGETILERPEGSILLAADNVVFDGFTVTGDASGPGLEGAMQTSENFSGYHIRNNIFRDNLRGLELRSTLTDPNQTLVENNLFLNNSDSLGGTGIESSPTLANATIRGNQFAGLHRTAAILLSDSTSADTTYDIRITDNTFLQGNDIYLSSVLDVTIHGNTFHGLRTLSGNQSAISVYEDSGNVSIVANTFLDRGSRAIVSGSFDERLSRNLVIADNLIRQDVGLLEVFGDSLAMIDLTDLDDSIQIIGNDIRLTGSLAAGAPFSVHGLRVSTDSSGDGDSQEVVIAHNTITAEGNPGTSAANLVLDRDVTFATRDYIVHNTFRGGPRGIDVLLQGSPVDAGFDIDIHFNNIQGHTGAGLRASSFPAAYFLDASNNFWGTAAGPNTAGADGTTQVGNAVVVSTPFLTVPQLTHADPFNGANGTPLNGASWNPLAGSYQIQGNRAVGTTDFNLATLNINPVAEVSVQAEVQLLNPGQYAGLTARHQGPGDTNLYFAALANDGGVLTAFLYRSIGGGWTLLDSATLPGVSAIVAHTLRFDVFGSALRLYVDDVLAASATDTSISGPGRIGLRGNAGVIVENFRAGISAFASGDFGVKDSFDRADSLSANIYMFQSGQFLPISQTLLANQGLNLITTHAVAADVNVEADLLLAADGQWGGLVARHSGPGDSDLYFAAMANVNGVLNVFLFRNLGGTYQPLGSMALPGLDPVAQHHLRFEAIGTALKVFVDGTLRLSAQDGSLSTGAAGIRAGFGAFFDNFSAERVIGVVPALPFIDLINANAANGHQLGRQWRQHAGNFNLANGTAIGTDGVNTATLHGHFVTDVAVGANFLLANGQFVGLAARHQGSGDSNMYFAALARVNDQFQAFLYVNVNGAWRLLNSASNISFGFAFMRFEVVGTQLRLLVGGTEVLTATDDTFSAGLAGMRTGAGSVLDNLVVTPL